MAVKNMGLNPKLVNVPKRTAYTNATTKRWNAIVKQADQDFFEYALQEREQELAEGVYSCETFCCGWTGKKEQLVKWGCPVCGCYVIRRNAK